MTRTSIRGLERQGIVQTAPGTLMQRAAQAICDETDRQMRRRRPDAWVLALVGPGNNGADALLAIMMLAQRGYRVEPYFVAHEPNAGSEAADIFVRWQSLGGSGYPIGSLAQQIEARGTQSILLDGLFGIGLNAPLRGDCARAAQLTHRTQNTVIAVDVPSGLDADCGAVIGGPRASAIRADTTITMLADKPGLHTGVGIELAGHVMVADLGLASAGLDGVRIDRSWVRTRLPKRALNSHKGSYGTVAIVGGAKGYSGAALLAASGARIVGAGKVATIGPDGPVFDPGQPQLMAWAMERPSELDRMLDGVDAIAIGCGLGTGAAGRSLLNKTMDLAVPLCLDADALNIIADKEHGAVMANRLHSHHSLVLTPHPLEAARLLSSTVQTVQANRIAAALDLSKRHNAVVLLKGAGTVLAAPDGRWGIICAGGPALATGGTGDILAGMVAGFLAQGHSPWEAAAVAAWLHGDAADRWSLDNPRARGLSANELISRIVDATNHC